MQPMTSFHELRVWQTAMDLVEAIYLLSKQFPSNERFGLTSQIRRAAVSIPSNIAEGQRRKRRKAFLFTSMSRWDRRPKWKYSSCSRSDWDSALVRITRPHSWERRP